MSWNTITLDAPIYLSGDEIWVGYHMTAPLNTYVVGMDGVANIPATNYIKSGPVWSEFDGVEGNGNFSIRANVVGAAWNEWMTVTPATGTVAGAMANKEMIEVEKMTLNKIVKRKYQNSVSVCHESQFNDSKIKMMMKHKIVPPRASTA